MITFNHWNLIGLCYVLLQRDTSDIECTLYDLIVILVPKQVL